MTHCCYEGNSDPIYMTAGAMICLSIRRSGGVWKILVSPVQGGGYKWFMDMVVSEATMVLPLKFEVLHHSRSAVCMTVSNGWLAELVCKILVLVSAGCWSAFWSVSVSDVLQKWSDVSRIADLLFESRLWESSCFVVPVRVREHLPCPYLAASVTPSRFATPLVKQTF